MSVGRRVGVAWWAGWSPLLWATLAAGQTAVPAERGPQPPARGWVGTCTSSERMWSVAAAAWPGAVVDAGQSWRLAAWRLDSAGQLSSSEGVTAGWQHPSILPAAAQVSWRDLVDGTTTVWTPLASWRTSVPVQPDPSTPAVSSVQADGGEFTCDGAVMRWPLLTSPGAAGVLLLAPGTTALAFDSGGHAAVVPVEPLPPVAGAAARKRRARAAAVPAGLAGTTEVLAEVVDAVPADGITAGRPVAWRITLLPSRAMGRLESSSAAVLAVPGGRLWLHQARGLLETRSGPQAWEGTLLQRAD